MHMESTSLYMSMITILLPSQTGGRGKISSSCRDFEQVWGYIYATIFLTSLDLTASSILIRSNAIKA